MKLSKVVPLLLGALPLMAQAQFSKPEEKFMAEERYMYPVYPGRPGSIAGTMGELRSTHFHSGLDIRTNNMVGYPVQASKSGYISRISMTGTGYGNVIYITHPDGNTTLYAHLLKFLGPLGNHVLQEQYRRKVNEIDLYFQEDEFAVKQGDTIALSGNTGSSSGPHLHFDIRDAQNYALDPIKLFGFPELVDNLAPAAEKIALRTLDIHSRINDRFGRFEFYAQRVGNNYILPKSILASGNIGVELVAKDKLAPRSQFYGGVNYIEMHVDSQLVFSQAIEKVNVAETRAIYTLMDFKTMRTKGTRFYKLYIEDGNDLEYYGDSPGNGKISVNPERESTVQIKMKDSDNNASTVTFRLKPAKPVQEVMSLEAYSSGMIADISENTMMVIAKPCKDSSNKAMLYANGTQREIEPDYFNNNQSVYLVDLRKSIPDSVTLCGESVVPKIVISIPSETAYAFYADQVDIQFPPKALYDTLYLALDYEMSKEGNETFRIGSRDVPLNKSIAVSLKPNKDYGQLNGTAIYRTFGNSRVYVGGEWHNGRIHFSTQEFGDFTIMKDSIGPGIIPISINRQAARFKIKDDLSGIASYEATIDGAWVLMTYDNKSNTIWSKLLDPAVPLKGMFELVVTDNAGNISRYSKMIL
ncbi:MAG: M23 family metallopeptidase [Cyclobacteriaceae bacterium]|nr:M23 family metallopeptidase [Cyclobacteriaceae bacterium]